MKIIVTGGCGFIGSHLVKKLLSKNHKVLNIDNLGIVSSPESLLEIKKSNKYTFKKINLRDYKKLRSIFLTFKPDVVFHLAAESHVDNSIINSKSFIETNIVGTYNLLESARDYLKEKKNYFRFIHISTDEVYGSLNLNEKKFTENNKFYPSSPYSASKASSDMLVYAWYKTYNLPTIITNCVNNFGAWQYPEKLIPVIVSQCIKFKKIPIYGNGQNTREWIFVNDHVDYLYNLIKRGKIGQCYNIGSGKELSNIKLAEKICSIFDKFLPKSKKYSSLINFVEDRKGHDFRYSVNYNKIKSIINKKNDKKFDENLFDTVKWYIDNKDWLLNKIK